MAEELVSVIIPTYNRFDRLKHAIQSVKSQTYSNIETIVINDASTESKYYTEKVDGVLLINLPVNNRVKYNTKAAQGMTRNYGLKVAEGNYVCFLDDDDYFLPRKIEVQVPVARIFGMCSSNMLYGQGAYDPSQKYELYFKQSLPAIFTKETIASTNYVNNSTVMMRKDILQKSRLSEITSAGGL